ncbi:hypothetical protein CL632_00770 [bacterium]|jgi:hypothetical protein|nr:hypothetical protein [bacterium]MDP6571479.1 hypothetical protein [Patescibacteria group bacterium]MDP6756178.1 hypothetical protein [Patescibacteria group bacterium]|tara:strand:+ start:47289 stop:47597 length:309 start_codon:yes stop_codon:yes gene_type:complete
MNALTDIEIVVELKGNMPFGESIELLYAEIHHIGNPTIKVFYEIYGTEQSKPLILHIGLEPYIENLDVMDFTPTQRSLITRAVPHITAFIAFELSRRKPSSS